MSAASHGAAEGAGRADASAADVREAAADHPAGSGDLRTRDVVAFGHEFGRVLSDGRIVGRAEPFAKVFPSSRAVKRAVGAIAWAILEDIALDAGPDEHGRLVSDTSVRRIAANLGMNKDTVARHLPDYRYTIGQKGHCHYNGLGRRNTP